MSVHAFYNISPEVYLFGKSDSTPEEHVRQWALFELMSAYGYLINNIRIEYPCQIGTKRFPADIVVLRDGRPYVVVECKQEKIDFRDDWAQVISYAHHLKAEYVVWTNGHEWRAKRNHKGQWYAAADIPSRTISNETRLNLADYMENFVELARPLFWVNRSVPIEFAPLFLGSIAFLLSAIRTGKLSKAPKSLQDGYQQLVFLGSEFGSNLLSDGSQIQQGLLSRLEGVLKSFQKFFDILGYDGKVEGLANRYDIEFSRSYIAKLIEEYELTGTLSERDGNVKETVLWQVMHLASCVRFLAQSHAEMNNHTAAYLAASEAILRYIEESRYSERAALSEGQVDQILSVFQKTLLSPLCLYLPAKLDPYGTFRLQKICQHYWDEYVAISKAPKPDSQLPDLVILDPDNPETQRLIDELEKAFDEQQLEDDLDELAEPDDETP